MLVNLSQTGVFCVWSITRGASVAAVVEGKVLLYRITLGPKRSLDLSLHLMLREALKYLDMESDIENRSDN